MASKHLAFVITINLVWLVLTAVAQEKMDQGKQAQQLSERFATELLVKKDAVEATKLTTVPFVEIVQGREDKPTLIKKSADVEKQFQAVVEDHEKLGIRRKVKIEKVYDAPEDVVLLEKIPEGVFNDKTDRIIAIDLTQEGGFAFGLLTLVSWRKEEPKVIGYGIYFSR